jgi:hypothetical protein
VSEEGTGLRKFFKDAHVFVEGIFVSVNCNHIRFVGVPVENHKLIVPMIFGNAMYQPQMAAAFPALLAVKYHYVPDTFVLWNISAGGLKPPFQNFPSAQHSIVTP